MKFALAFAAVLAVASAQFGNFGNFGKQPARFAPRPVSSVPRPVSPAPRPPAPVGSRVSSGDQGANVLRYDNDIGPDGSYTYDLETDNGISVHAQGTPRAFGGNPPVAPVVSQGSFGWTSPEGQAVSLTYVADENGYQPSGDSLPVPPPIPEAIARALAYISKYQKK